VTVNGTRRDFASGTSVADVVAALGTSDRGVAVALGREVVPRSQWAACEVPDGAELEIVTAAAGG